MTPDSSFRSLTNETLEAVDQHPLWIESQQYSYRVAEEIVMEKQSINRMTIEMETRKRMFDALADVDEILVVSVFTADRRPEPLSGAGTHFLFFLHPVHRTLLHADRGTWRS